MTQSRIWTPHVAALAVAVAGTVVLARRTGQVLASSGGAIV